MTTPELRPFARPITPPPKEPYWNFWRVLTLVMVIVGTPILIDFAVLSWIGHAAQKETKRLMSLQDSLDAQARAKVQPVSMPKVVRTVVIQHPPKSIEECNALTGNLINEQWAKCRHGWSERMGIAE